MGRRPPEAPRVWRGSGLACSLKRGLCSETPAEGDAGREGTASRAEEEPLEQENGHQGAAQKRKASLKDWWRDARPTKTVVFWSWIGSVVLSMSIGFAWGGWVTGGTARSMTQTLADEAVVKRLAPRCVVQVKQAPGKDQKVGAIMRLLHGKGSRFRNA
jgi:hypothetical protein